MTENRMWEKERKQRTSTVMTKWWTLIATKVTVRNFHDFWSHEKWCGTWLSKWYSYLILLVLMSCTICFCTTKRTKRNNHWPWLVFEWYDDSNMKHEMTRMYKINEIMNEIGNMIQNAIWYTIRNVILLKFCVHERWKWIMRTLFDIPVIKRIELSPLTLWLFSIFEIVLYMITQKK